jgi:alkylated DNA repair dioxygenase AlkB
VSAAQRELFSAAAALPEGFVYATGFIDEAEEASLLETLAALPFREARFREYTARRRVMYYGAAYDFTSNALAEAPPLPAFLLPLREKIAAWMGLAPSALEHALINEYRPGTPLGWHRDAPDFEHVAGVSLGGWARMRLRTYPPQKGAKATLLELAPRSAYRMQGAARWQWQHSISATRTLRYSITFRTLRPA